MGFGCEFRDTPFERVNLMAVPFGSACFDGEFTDDCGVCPLLAQCQGNTLLANSSAASPPAAATSGKGFLMGPGMASHAHPHVIRGCIATYIFLQLITCAAVPLAQF